MLAEAIQQISDLTRAASETASTLQHAKRSIGKTLEQEVAGTGQLPEYVVLEVPAFAAGFHVIGQVKCALEPDVGTETFQLLPLPGQVERLLSGAEESLGATVRDLVKESGVAVYYGQP